MTELMLCQTGSHLLRDHEVTHRLATELEELIARVTRVPVRWTNDGTEVRLTSPINFRDGIGSGSVTGEVFWYRGEVRVDVRLEHNRTFAGPDGGVTERPCYLNDFVASVTVAADETVPPTFAREVARGIQRAREAVDKHNEQHSRPWNLIHVAAAV